LGSLFWIEIANKQWHRNREVGLAKLYAEIAAYYAANPERGFTKVHLTLQQIITKNPGFWRFE
jgi:hypothetical protein